MSGVGKNGNTLGGGENAMIRQPTGSTLIAFAPMGGKANRPARRPLGKADRAHSAHLGAEVIPFRPRGFAAVAQSSTRSAPAGTQATIGDDRLGATGEEDWRLRMLEDFLGLAWVAASMVAGYYMLTAVSTVS